MQGITDPATQRGIIPRWVIITPTPLPRYCIHSHTKTRVDYPQVSYYNPYSPPPPPVLHTQSHKDKAGLSLGESSSSTPVLHAQDAQREGERERLSPVESSSLLPPQYCMHKMHTQTGVIPRCVIIPPPPRSIACTRWTHRQGLSPGVSSSLPPPVLHAQNAHTRGDYP